MTLVVGTNLCTETEFLTEIAARLAKRMGESLRLVHVVEEPVLSHRHEPLRLRLKEEAERLQNLCGAKVRVHLAAGSVDDVLAKVAEMEVATALIVGSRPQYVPHFPGNSPVPFFLLREAPRLKAWLQDQAPLRILIGADAGHAATAARAFGARLASLGGCTVDVVHIVSPAAASRQLALPLAACQELTPELEAPLLHELQNAAPPEEQAARPRVMMLHGNPETHLVTLAREEGFDLIIIGQRQHSRVEQLWNGSVAWAVMRDGPVSVVCVPPPPASLPRPFEPYRTIVVGVDFTATTDQALVHALGLLAPRGTLHLAHVVPFISFPSDAREAQEGAWYKLSKMELPDSLGHARELQEHVLEGDAAEQILALAKRVGADLIILGTRSRPALSRTVLGSVARAVTEHARIPVLLVPYGKL
ncbi:universal stress protein [Oligoflexus tunisiensis]|uniref:universal stress protein n=1 Tax=Oligoflexus tunisiensis TaxID=708132 RepID=UPI00114D3210|nr:universal stress protein [Oligoflexus tunisiensis]